jgi:hypothetical protein
VAACALLAALAPAAGATMRADVDAGGLVLTDVDGTADDITLADRTGGPFVELVGQDNLLGTVCPATGASNKFAGFDCPPSPLVRIDTGGGNDTIDARRLSTLLHVTLGPGSDVIEAGGGADDIVVADGARDVVSCGPGQDVVEGVADPNDDIAANCETAQRSFTASLLPKSVTVAAPSTVTFAIGRAGIPLSFAATLTTAPPKHGKHAKVRTLAHTTVPQGTGPVQLRFKLPKVSKGFLSKRPNIRVQVNATAIGADGRRYPLSLHSQAPGPRPALTTLYDNQFRLVIPARLRHPHGG